MKRNLKTGLMLAFIAGLLALFAYPDYRQGEPSMRGKAAKDFELTLDGKQAKLSTDLRGKIVVLNFWATWCPPCVEETASLNLLQAWLAPKGGTVLGVSVDDDQSAYDTFLNANHVIFPTYRDNAKAIPASYGTTMYPETYVIDRNGHIDRKIIGPQDWTSPEMLEYFNNLLAEK